MRPLKFRKPVVCQEGHKAFWYYEIHSKGVGEVYQRGVPRSYEAVCKCPKSAIGEGWFENGDDEQTTGLKDKNGVEIYEGDIMRHAQTPKLYPSEVYFHEEFGGYWPLVNTTNGYNAEKWEVIGNIYENKELLK